VGLDAIFKIFHIYHILKETEANSVPCEAGRVAVVILLCLKMPFKKTFVTEEPAVELLVHILFW